MNILIKFHAIFGFIWCAFWFLIFLTAWKPILTLIMGVFIIITILQLLNVFELITTEELYFSWRK